jgi:hypothetical protein
MEKLLPCQGTVFSNIKRRSFSMKNALKTFGIIALVAIIGFSMAACSGGGGGTKGNELLPDPTKTSYISWDDSNNKYVLTVWKKGTAKAAYVPKDGDNYELVIIAVNGDEFTSTGTVKSATSGKLELESKGTSFTIETSGTAITAITAPNEIPLDNGKTQKAPAALTSVFPTIKLKSGLLYENGVWVDEVKGNVKVIPAANDEIKEIRIYPPIDVRGYKKLYTEFTYDPINDGPPWWLGGGLVGYDERGESEWEVSTVWNHFWDENTPPLVGYNTYSWDLTQGGHTIAYLVYLMGACNVPFKLFEKIWLGGDDEFGGGGGGSDGPSLPPGGGGGTKPSVGK